jgi:hypothetical protein
VAGRKADRTGVFGQIVEAEGAGVLDQDSEDPAAVRVLTDIRAGRGVDTVTDEALETGAARIDHPKRGVSCARHLRRRLRDPLEHDVEGELGADRDSRLHERPQTAGFPRRRHPGQCSQKPTPALNRDGHCGKTAANPRLSLTDSAVSRGWHSSGTELE